MENIAVYGAGGFGREIACLINIINEKEPTWNIVGFFDDGIKKDSTNSIGKILGGVNDLNKWKEKLAITVAIGDPKTLTKIINQITNPLIYFPNIIAPDLIMLDKTSIKMGIGNIFQTRCGLSCNVSVGDFNVFNGNILIGHDTQIGSYNVFMPSVYISGEVGIGNCNFMGVASVILQKINMGNSVHVGAGSLIFRNTKDNAHYIGNPGVMLKF